MQEDTYVGVTTSAQTYHAKLNSFQSATHCRILTLITENIVGDFQSG